MTDPLWDHREDRSGDDLVGYGVEATDGSIGKVDEATHEAGTSYVVVDTGPWIFGRKVLLPAGTIVHVDHEERVVHVDRTKDAINDAPEFDEQADRDRDYLNRYGDYYGGGSAP
jgi:hypothetical protein